MKSITLIFLTMLYAVSTYGQKTETIYLTPGDSTANYYIAVQPANHPVRAFMLLIPGAFQTPQYVLQQTTLPFYAAEQGILTIIPTFTTGISSFGVDDATQESLNAMLMKVLARYKLQQKDFYIGGLSIGGTCAVKYTELAIEKNYPVKPKAVFGIDPPLDFERFYNAATRIMRISGNNKPNEEIPYMINRISQEMQGTPQTALQNFYNRSPYSFSDVTQRAVRILKDTPVLLITEPDVNWWLSQRGYDYTSFNAIDQAAMINELQRLGNRRAVLRTTDNKGYREPAHTRHPHSWSIADPKQLVSWLLQS